MSSIPIELSLPLKTADVQQLHVGDFVYLNGRIFTARDAVHKFLADGNPPPCSLKRAAIYHCGPIVVKTSEGRRVIAAGPTTSVREEPYMADLIQRLTLTAVIGKGGMGRETLQACRECGCLYLHAVGGAAQVLAESIVRVVNVYLEDQFGSPEALWEFEVRHFPAIITMDAHGCSLHAETEKRSRRKLQYLLGKKNRTAHQ